MAFVTASLTAVRRSLNTSSVGFSCTVKADTAAPRLQKEFYERVKTIKDLD